jgi:hypothetical protein
LERLDPKYEVRYGSGGTEIVEHFSLSCRTCADCFAKDFQGIQEDYIDSGKASWIFHPTPADLLTLQYMVCLEKLSEEEKPLFFESVFESIASSSPKEGCRLLQAAMEVLGRPVPDLDKIEFLEKTEAFQDALEYLKQEDVISVVPTLEIDGKRIDKTPTRTIIDTQLTRNS